MSSLGFLLVGTSSYLGKNFISLVASQEILFFPQGIVMSFYGIAVAICGALFCGCVGSGYDLFDRKEGIVRIFRWGFPGKSRRIFLRFLMKDIQSIRIEVKEGVSAGVSFIWKLEKLMLDRNSRSNRIHKCVFLPWLISLCCNKSLKTWITNWWNTRQCETFLNDIQEKSVLEKFIQLEELFQLDEMIKEYPETDLQQFRLGIHKETIQFIKIHNEYRIHTILHFSTNLISFVILSGYSFGLFRFFITDLCIGFHSPHGWELMIGYIYKDLGLLIMSKFYLKYLSWIREEITRSISVSLMIYIITWASISSAYPIFAQQNYENPREATGRIVCANCHLASKPVDIEVPQAVLPDTVFEAVVKIPYDMQLKQVLANGGYEITIVDASNERQVIDIIPRGLELLVSEGESIKLDQPLTSNPNVGGLGGGCG
ncbi:hypothetical protein HID58_092794 [Brassica napus]|uniref:Cytochrome f n=2 Tax=Brassiceae TaxID=981071 RepID=A0ABQ7XD81_BRANA|nr:hypothetical protein HID58_092794 [Brassica napus]